MIMKTRIKKICTGLVLASTLVFTSCDKEKDEPTRSELIVGTWTLSAYGQDDNMNGILESSEQDPIPAGAGLIEVFNSNGTGSVTTTPAGGGASTTSSITWQLQSNDQQLAVTTTSTATTSIAIISLLNSTQLMGYDPAASPRIIFLLTK